MFFCSLLHTIYEVDEDHDHWTSFLSVYPDNNSGRCFSLISKIIISHLVYMELWELVLYLGKDECKHSTACWGEAACCIFSLRCWISSSVPHRNIFINCISDSWVFFQAILRRLSLQGSKIQWDFAVAHSWQGDKPTHCRLCVQYSGVQIWALRNSPSLVSPGMVHRPLSGASAHFRPCEDLDIDP